MTRLRVMACASVLMVVGAWPAAAQFPPPPPPPSSGAAAQGNPFPPPPAPPGSAPARPSPFPSPGAPGASNPCEAFLPLRQQAERDAKAIEAAGQRKATREQVCPLFRRFAASESRMVKFLVSNQEQCRIPPQAIKEAKTSHSQTIKIRNQVCSAPPPAARGPSLSDVLGGPAVPDPEPPRGMGTFDTLTGNPLAR